MKVLARKMIAENLGWIKTGVPAAVNSAVDPCAGAGYSIYDVVLYHHFPTVECGTSVEMFCMPSKWGNHIIVG